MTTILSAVSLALGIVIFLVATHLSFHRWGYRKGQRNSFERIAFQAGYLAGRKDESNWWIGVEDQANQNEGNTHYTPYPVEAKK